MTRRDTIIVAVLVNAGLLIVLFASALKSGAPQQEFAASSVDKVEQQIELSVKKEEMTSHGDEVDQVLKQYANPVPAAVPYALTQVSESASQVHSSPASFADDLRAITLPETPAASVAQLAAQSSTPSATDQIEYKVKKGDVLEKIARHHHCAVDEIMKMNKLASTNLRIGQTLKIPSKSALTAQIVKSSPQASAATSNVAAKYYVVKNGDNPWTIAVKNHMKVEELLKLNNLDQEKARKLKPGDQLRIN